MQILLLWQIWLTVNVYFYNLLPGSVEKITMVYDCLPIMGKFRYLWFCSASDLQLVKHQDWEEATQSVTMFRFLWKPPHHQRWVIICVLLAIGKLLILSIIVSVPMLTLRFTDRYTLLYRLKKWQFDQYLVVIRLDCWDIYGLNHPLPHKQWSNKTEKKRLNRNNVLLFSKAFTPHSIVIYLC